MPAHISRTPRKHRSLCTPAAAASSKARPDLSWTPAAMMQSAVSGSREVMTAHALAAREPAGARSANKVPAIRHPLGPDLG